MPSLKALAARVLDGVRVNRAWPVTRDGRVLWHKRRRRGMSLALLGGNAFLALAHSRLRMFVDRGAWRRWEVECFCRLHAPLHEAGEVDSWEVWFDALPGTGYRELLARGNLTGPALEAAARELHRAHALIVPSTGERLSHGDPHMGNLLYDAREGRAYLIDFEQAHARGVDARWRHADDLIVFVLDLLGRAPDAAWPHLGRAFLAAYPDRAVLDAVRARLAPPAGFEAILWMTRTDHRPWSLVTARLEALERVL